MNQIYFVFILYLHDYSSSFENFETDAIKCSSLKAILHLPTMVIQLCYISPFPLDGGTAIDGAARNPLLTEYDFFSGQTNKTLMTYAICANGLMENLRNRHLNDQSYFQYKKKNYLDQ